MLQKGRFNEESGIQELQMIKELGNYSRLKINKDGREDTSESKTIYMFLFRTTETNLNPIDPENPEALWLEKEKVANQLSHPKDKDFFLNIFKEI